MADRLRFAEFELEVPSGDLYVGGSRVRLAPQPARLLVALARRPGEVLTREELRQELWDADTFVDFENGLNFCVQQLRSALGDDARNPRFVETVPRRGYRLVAAPGAAARPASRFPQAAVAVLALLAVLAASWLTWPRPPRRMRIAVLPVEARDEGDGVPELASALTDDLSHALSEARPASLTVVGRGSSEALRGTRITPEEVGRKLSCDFVLLSSLEFHGSRLRLLSRLVRTADGAPVWNGTYETERENASALRRVWVSVAARAAADRLAPPTLPEASAARYRPDADDAFFAGRYLAGKGTPEALASALEQFRRVIEIEPRHAPAHAALADALHRLVQYGRLNPRDAYPEARSAAATAVGLDPTLAEGHAAQGSVLLWYDWRPAEALRAFEAALERNPSLGAARHDEAWALLALHRDAEALAMMREARDLDPLSLRTTIDIGWLTLHARLYEVAAEECRRTLVMEPGFVPAEACAIEASARQNHPQDAVRTWTALAASRKDAETLAALGGDDPGEALARARTLRLSRLLQKERPPFYDLATLASGLGRRDDAIRWLRAAEDAREGMMVVASSDPSLDPLASDARFQEILARVRSLPTT
jgi:DNA-binding winged helix-turn-helix (wHTH) protein/TolB-like protein